MAGEVMLFSDGFPLLTPDGFPATDPDCCCLPANCCSLLPGTLYVDVVWCGTNTITLNEVLPTPCANCRYWRGVGRFGGVGNNDATFELKCCEGTFPILYRFDGCVGFPPGTECAGQGFESWAGPEVCDPFPFTRVGAPPAGCNPGCFDMYSITFRK